MSSVFITVGMFSLFVLLKNRRNQMQPVLDKYSPMMLAMSMVVMSYPFWAVVGGALALLYHISLVHAPGGGLGSPNMLYTLAIAVGGLALAAPFMLLLRRVLAGILTLTLVFIGLFGWFLPYFAA